MKEVIAKSNPFLVRQFAMRGIRLIPLCGGQEQVVYENAEEEGVVIEVQLIKDERGWKER